MVPFNVPHFPGVKETNRLTLLVQITVTTALHRLHETERKPGLRNAYRTDEKSKKILLRTVKIKFFRLKEFSPRRVRVPNSVSQIGLRSSGIRGLLKLVVANFWGGCESQRLTGSSQRKRNKEKRLVEYRNSEKERLRDKSNARFEPGLLAVFATGNRTNRKRISPLSPVLASTNSNEFRNISLEIERTCSKRVTCNCDVFEGATRRLK